MTETPLESSLFSLAFLGLGLSCRNEYYLIFSLDPFRIQSKTSILMHLFTHVDNYHLLSNFYQIAVTSYSLRLSFPLCALLFTSSGLIGTSVFMIEKWYSTSKPWIYEILPHTALTHLDRYLSLPKNTFAICGASGAAYGFLGAEISIVLKKICRIRSTKYSALQRYRAEEDLARLMVFGIINLTQMGIGIVNGQSEIGHSAHLGGLLVGLAFGYFYL